MYKWTWQAVKQAKQQTSLNFYWVRYVVLLSENLGLYILTSQEADELYYLLLFSAVYKRHTLVFCLVGSIFWWITQGTPLVSIFLGFDLCHRVAWNAQRCHGLQRTFNEAVELGWSMVLRTQRKCIFLFLYASIVLFFSHCSVSITSAFRLMSNVLHIFMQSICSSDNPENLRNHELHIGIVSNFKWQPFHTHCLLVGTLIKHSSDATTSRWKNRLIKTACSSRQIAS